MTRSGSRSSFLVLAVLGLGWNAPSFGGANTAGASADPAQSEQVERGEYLARAGGCGSCHTDVAPDSPPMAGGRPIETRFGTFYGTNITPDPVHGIGRWSEADFLRAMRHGLAPDGHAYYPAFPYPSFTRMSDEDLLSLRAWLSSLPASPRSNRPHELRPGYRSRLALSLWRRLSFRPGPMAPAASRSEELNRGAYLVEAVAHCGECHTPRNRLGAPKRDKAMAGSSGLEGEGAPNITFDVETGIGDWSVDDLVSLLQTGLTPDGDVMGGLMAEVVRNGTSQMTVEDLRAMTVYLQSLPPIRTRRDREDEKEREDRW